jgi:hypothetical protein
LPPVCAYTWPACSSDAGSPAARSRQARQKSGARAARRPRVAVGRDDQDGRAPQLAHHIGEQDRRRLVRPLQIIEYQQQAGRPGRLGQPPAHLGEQREPLGGASIGAVGQSRTLGVTEQSRPQVGTGRSAVSGPDGGLIQHQPPQAVRRQTAPVGRPGPRHRNAPRRGQHGGLLGQPGFPDPGLARAQHQPPAAGNLTA